MATNDVIEWLISYKIPFVRINHDGDTLEELKVSIEDDGPQISFVYQGEVIRLSDIKGYWYRRGGFPDGNSEADMMEMIFPAASIVKDLRTYKTREEQKLKYFMYKLLDKLPNKIGSYFTADPSKLYMLYLAALNGLHIPQTLITTSKQDVCDWKELHNGIITKSIHNLVITETYGRRYVFYTEEVSDEVLNETPLKIFPSLIQKKLEKAYELRIFYLKGKFYSMAIFSQSDAQTAVDFRNYNFSKPNRNVPFRLPVAIEKQLKSLMDMLELETGSIDMVVTPEKEFIFLEVNPVGQFGQVAGPCNYPLYKEIARHLAEDMLI
jgi:ATP-GRASP peptide maturase of grasp-with-spasm system